jgi:hypothetical protein
MSIVAMLSYSDIELGRIGETGFVLKPIKMNMMRTDSERKLEIFFMADV